jgi:hypothetical protein
LFSLAVENQRFMNEYKKLQKELPIKLEIVVKRGHWLINGKTYAECGFVEKYYFDLYLRYQRRGEKAQQIFG